MKSVLQRYCTDTLRDHTCFKRIKKKVEDLNYSERRRGIKKYSVLVNNELYKCMNVQSIA